MTWFRRSPSRSSALRRDAGPARQVILPYFDVALRGGSNIAAKQIGAVALNFPAGSQHARTRAQASVRVNRAQRPCQPMCGPFSLVRERRARRRRRLIPWPNLGSQSAVANATFEHLVGFQLTQDQLKYNATR